ncbi:hypothetical protein [Mycobacteroides franklinii]|nr:hypothetical protein [Mycobacteroides franklinii]
MSNQSKRQGSPSVSRDAAQFSEALARRFRLLSKAAREYDAGDDDQVVVMAAILRVLLTDRLIDRVTPLDQLDFADTADRLPAGAVAGYGYGITRIKIYAGQQSGGRIVAPLGGAYREREPPTVPFTDWWSKDSVIYATNRPFRTREYVVYEMANTDAIHVDPDLDADYDALTRDTHGFQFNGIPIGGNLASAAVRQIVWEAQHTLHRVLPDLCGSDFPDSPDELTGDELWRVAAMPKEEDSSNDH